MNDDVMIKIEHVSKQYRLGEIGGTTLYETFQRLRAKLFHKEDPTKKIGAKNYNKGEKFLALNDINLEVKKGERVGIIGHNGAGKSTLLKLLCRVTAPTSGTIGLNGRIASMLEVGTGFHPELTGRENIYMNGAILGMTKREIDAKMEDIIEFSEVREFIDTPVKRYSSGMYVKLAFSVAAHLDSEIIIMDEVLAVGDVAFQRKCLEKMNRASTHEGKSVLYVSHNMSTIRQLCDRVIVLEHGTVVFDGDVEEGIARYLFSQNNELAKKIDLSERERPEISQNKLLMQSVEFLNVDAPKYSRGDAIKCRVVFQSKEHLPNLHLRISLRSSRDNAVATSVSHTAINNVADSTNEFTFELDSSLLSQDKYFMSLALFQRNSLGHYTTADHVSRACMFEISESSYDMDNISTWSNIWCGNIHYPAVKIHE